MEAFAERQSGNTTEDLEPEGKDELKLILEVLDILDELNMLMVLFEKQARVVSDLQRKLSRVKRRETQLEQNDTPARSAGTLRAEGCSVGDVTLNAVKNNFDTLTFTDCKLGNIKSVGDYSVEATSLLLGGYAGDLMEQAADRVQTEKTDVGRLQSEVAKTHELVSCSGSDSVTPRRVAHCLAHSSWGCWT